MHGDQYLSSIDSEGMEYQEVKVIVVDNLLRLVIRGRCSNSPYATIVDSLIVGLEF